MLDFLLSLHSCLEVDVDKRASADELLSHRFLKKARRPSAIIPLIKATKDVLKRAQDRQ